MRTRHTRTAAAAAAVVATGAVGFSLRPAPQPTATLAARNPAIEVRTVVIKRTIHVRSHRQSPRGVYRGRGHGTAPGAGTLRTAVARTRTSGRHSSPSPGGSGSSAPVTTRSSRAGSAVPSSSSGERLSRR
jgi:hypothetical protein